MENQVMISNKDLYKEIKDMDTYLASEKDAYKKNVVKGLTLAIKLLHNIRTNMTVVMKHLKIELVKPREGQADAEE
jgi:hypothetical protein